MKVDPQKQTYFTIRCSGDEVDEDYLILFCEGKQVGYRHLGDVDVLALPDEAPRYNGRFYYVTTPLPIGLTQGRSRVAMEIRSTGPIFGYAATFDKYQKLMTLPSRKIYRVYTHTDGSFAPPDDDTQGQEPRAIVRTEPGVEVIDRLKDRVNGSIDGLLKSKTPLNQMQIQFLARAYAVTWTHAYQSPKAVAQVVAGIDRLHERWKKDPDELWNDKSTWNPGWFGVGPAGDAVRRLGRVLDPVLDKTLDGRATRRAGWSAMFQASRDWLRTHRLWLTNQAMFTDVNLYLCDQAVATIDPTGSLPKEKALDYLYQSVGIVPWLGIDTPTGPAKPFGKAFFQVTSKGLTRERGYSGGYGEGGVEGAMDIYEATRDETRQGNAKIKAQLTKMVQARGSFRYRMLDADNHPAMRLETAVGWRDTHLPGDVTYVERGTGEHSPLQGAAATLDPVAVGYAQQMFADNQFFVAVEQIFQDTRFRATVGLLDLPDDYYALQKQPASPYRLPMDWDQPDSIFADEEDGVVAIKHGREILYASLYWRAGYGINHLARTHYLTPTYQQVGVIYEDAQFTPSGETYARPDWINFGFGNGGTNIKYPSALHQASAGEKLPVARIPEGVKFRVGDESHFSGFAECYILRFGRYLIGMNTTISKRFSITVPADMSTGETLSTPHISVRAGDVIPLPPRSTCVLFAAD